MGPKQSDLSEDIVGIADLTPGFYKLLLLKVCIEDLILQVWLCGGDQMCIHM